MHSYLGKVESPLRHVRISVFLLGFCLAMPAALHAQDPGAQQDAEAAREKLLKAADQLDMIETNSEATKTSLDSMKADIARLQDQNTAVKQQLADLQAAFDKSEAVHAKERQVLLDEVAKMVAAGKGPAKPAKKKEMVAITPPTDVPASVAATTSAANAETPPGTNPAPTPTPAVDPAPVKPQKGYYHVVEAGETLTLICSAYRQQGINVTIGEVQKANGLTDKSVLKVGQKIFIPKPGT